MKEDKTGAPVAPPVAPPVPTKVERRIKFVRSGTPFGLGYGIGDVVEIPCPAIPDEFEQLLKDKGVVVDTK